MAVSDSADVLKHSVTAGDIIPGQAQAGLWNFIHLNLGGRSSLLTTSLPDLAEVWNYKTDDILARTVLYQGDWASAIAIAITKMSSLAWQSDAQGSDDKGQARLRVKRANEMFHAANFGKGWVNFLTQHLRDYLTCCNGGNIEVVRATKGYGSKIIGLCHLSSRRCYRTGDPDTPIIYRDRLGADHPLKWYQVISITDLADPDDSFFDVGQSAALRAYERIRTQAIFDRYILEKAGGFNSNALIFLNGISDTALKSAVLMGDKNRQQRGAYTYRGATMIPVVDAEKFEKLVVELASLPDGFVYKDELATTLHKYANSIGLDVQDLMPLSHQGFGTGAQSHVLENKAKGKGLAAWQSDFTHLMNTFVLPDSVTFSFSEKDLADNLKNAQVLTAQITAVTTAVQGGVLTAQEAKQLLVDMQAIPENFIPNDQTPDTVLSSEDKLADQPAEDTQQQGQVDLTATPAPAPAKGQPNGSVSKGPGQLPGQS